MNDSFYENRICIFIDILGFRKLVDSTIVDNKEIDENIRKIEYVISYLKKIILDRNSSNQITQFSDSFIVSFKQDEPSGLFYTLLDILHLQFEAAFQGVLLRGGVTNGLLYHKNGIVFGPALIDAYELESSAAIYPRIIIEDKEVIELCSRYSAFPERGCETEKEHIEELLQEDSDGVYYINYLDEDIKGEFDYPEESYAKYLIKLRSLITELLKSKNIRIKMKASWMKNKFNKMIRSRVDNKNNIVKNLINNGYDCDLVDFYKTLDIIK